MPTPTPSNDSEVSLKTLLVDDDQNICRTLSVSLRTLHCNVTEARSVDQAVELLKSQSFDWVLSDFRMGEKTGADLIREAQKIDPQLTLAIMTAFASIDNAIEVTRAGAFDYLPKPFTQTQLAHLLKKVRTVVSLKKENKNLKIELGKTDLFSGFTSVAQQRLEEFVKKVAPTDATVLLTGESGTGKSELARKIHQFSNRSQLPLITVNCTSLAESVLESEIFGHAKGAFTGAFQEKLGKFELAHHGTLFLDEIGDLSLGAQAKLLRFLQERVIERVGSNHTITVDARVIAATNKNLEEAVIQGRFREDLYYRLNIFECLLVPIRHRKEDVPVLIHKFAAEFAKYSKLPSMPIPEAVMKVLEAYTWPGNIREIRNSIERLVILSAGREARVDDLPEKILRPPQTPSDRDGDLCTLEELDKRHIQKVLRLESNLENAAEILGITKVTLWRKRKEYGLP